MPAFNFQPRFAADVEAGVKRQTIRATRRQMPRVGQTAYLFTGMRTAACRRLGEHPITRVDGIEIKVDGSIWLTVEGALPFFLVGDATRDRFAQADGLADAAELVAWIETHHGLPFRGFVTYW